MKDAAAHVDRLLEVVDMHPHLVVLAGVPAIARAGCAYPQVAELADLVAQLSPEQLAALAIARRDLNWVGWREFSQEVAREIRAEEEAAALERHAERAGRSVA